MSNMNILNKYIRYVVTFNLHFIDLINVLNTYQINQKNGFYYSDFQES